MTPNDRPSVSDLDHEALSALFDGELHGDAARFALRRLGHDAGWQQACGRWQLIGDALRGQSTGAADAGLAPRIAAALVGEPTPVLQAAPPPDAAPGQQARGSRWLRRGWAGGAMAASVAAALFVARPFGHADSQVPADAAPAVAQAASPVQAVAPARIDEPPPRVPAAGDAPAAEPVAVRRVAVAPPRRAHATARRVPHRVVDMSPAAEPAVVATVDPFGVPAHDEVVTRPWPRAVLPGSTAAGTLTASYGTSAESPSFYPFEPQLPPSHPPAAAGSPQP